MSFKVEILPSAWKDLKSIEDYYALEFDADTAIAVVDSILDRIEKLEIFPDIGNDTPDPWLNKRDYRMLICKKHVAIFRKIDKSIYVYHIFNTRSDYPKLFKSMMAEGKVRKDLEEIVDESGQPLRVSEEYDWGEPKGREIW
jgi:toxin ParE1/3/4